MSEGETTGAVDKPTARRAARLAAVQALYQMEVGGKGLVDAVAEFEAHWIGREVEGIQFRPADARLFREIVAGAVEQQIPVDRLIDKTLSQGWPLTRIEAVLRAILRAGAFELAFRKDVPAKVVISEYVEVAHDFYEADEPALVNGVLDGVAREVRFGELKERGRPAPYKAGSGKAGSGSKAGPGKASPGKAGPKPAKA